MSCHGEAVGSAAVRVSDLQDVYITQHESVLRWLRHALEPEVAS